MPLRIFILFLAMVSSGRSDEFSEIMKRIDEIVAGSDDSREMVYYPSFVPCVWGKPRFQVPRMVAEAKNVDAALIGPETRLRLRPKESLRLRRLLCEQYDLTVSKRALRSLRTVRALTKYVERSIGFEEISGVGGGMW